MPFNLVALTLFTFVLSSIVVLLFGCAVNKSNKSGTTQSKKRSTCSTNSKPQQQQQQQQLQQSKPNTVIITSKRPPAVANVVKPNADKLPPSRPSSSAEKEKVPVKKVVPPPASTPPPSLPPPPLPSKQIAETKPHSKERTYLDETQQSKISISEPAPDPGKTDEKQLSKTPATEAKTIDVVPVTRVKLLGDLDTSVLKKRAQVLKEIEEMGSVHDFDKPQCKHSVENAEPIDPNRHVIVAENKFKLYLISTDEIIEEQPTQRSVVERPT